MLSHVAPRLDFKLQLPSLTDVKKIEEFFIEFELLMNQISAPITTWMTYLPFCLQKNEQAHTMLFHFLKSPDFQILQGERLYSCTKQALLQTFGTPYKVRMDEVLRRDHELRQRPNQSISEFVEEYQKLRSDKIKLGIFSPLDPKSCETEIITYLQMAARTFYHWGFFVLNKLIRK